jgi:hypothetical protein
MSSHYFVKEGQEPALMIFDAMPFSAASDLLAWAPLVVVSDRALESVLSWGIKIDVVLDFSEPKEQTELLDAQQPLQILRASDHASGLKEVFQYLHSVNNPAVTILTNDPVGIISSIDGHTKVEVTIQSGTIRWSRIARDFQKWLPAGSQFHLLQVSGRLPPVHGAIEDNGVFVTSDDGIVHISPAQPVWMGELINS